MKGRSREIARYSDTYSGVCVGQSNRYPHLIIRQVGRNLRNLVAACIGVAKLGRIT
jgi:hypothetical protein